MNGSPTRPTATPMLEHIPAPILLFALVGVLLAGPVILLSLFLGGVTAAAVAAFAVSLCGVAFYMLVVRHYGER